MDELRRRAWQALDIGPVWRLRASGPAALNAGEDVHADSPADPRTGPRSDPRLDLPTEATPVEETACAPAADLDWPALREAVAGCQACRLCETRRNTVFGVGVQDADWMFVGEAPGEQEDLRGEPFVGPAGKLLDAMLAALGRSRQRDVYIANVLKCRPPGNRDPQPAERAQCLPYLARQIELVAPKLIVVLGKPAAHALLETEVPVASLRGRVHRRRVGEREVPVIVTYHPAYLLRKPQDKAKAWADLVLALRTSREG